MDKDILLSICIPTYKRAKYLDTCLQSIMHYKENDIEILVQNNNSPDETEDIVKQYIHDPRIIYEKNTTNIGSVANVWKLIDKAKGQYVFCLTDDDYFLPSGIKAIIEYIKADKPVCFKSPLIMLLEESKKSSYYTVNDSSKASLFLFAHIFTGLCFNKQKLFEKFDEKFKDSIYPSMVIMGLLLEDATYLDKPIAMHIWENEVHWDNNMEPGSIEVQNEMLNLILLLEDYLDLKVYKNIIIEYSVEQHIIPAKFLPHLTTKEKYNTKKRILKDKSKQLLISTAKILLGKS